MAYTDKLWQETPLIRSIHISSLLGCDVYLKLEVRSISLTNIALVVRLIRTNIYDIARTYIRPNHSSTEAYPTSHNTLSGPTDPIHTSLLHQAGMPV